MNIHPEKIAQIWDRRIELLRDRIKLLRNKGFTGNDDEIRELYERLKFFEECRRRCLAEVAWVYYP